ncbi:hypothetical protein RND71_004911 [Anisodus tanguticus]|uniref:C2H2-type domain-containing protein n=1 Tax=Anisodus tanguticus TaxID=243964 RepID=A0AAE1SP21_9SOLA|nr:hypothetical protein RND71_004911 [Anisodus tanguticus]
MKEATMIVSNSTGHEAWIRSKAKKKLSSTTKPLLGTGKQWLIKIRLVEVATYKFIGDVATDALHISSRKPFVAQTNPTTKLFKVQSSKFKVLNHQIIEMPGLTCNACDKEFVDDTEQKLHYKSEWHRYNLKRKNSDLNCSEPL